MALDRLNIDFESVGISEVDEFALLSYEAIHDNKGEVDKISDEEKRKYLEKLNVPIDTDTMKLKNLKGKRLHDLYRAVKNTKNYGDISKIKPEELPDMDLFTYSFPCFTGDSLILTDNGYKEIKNIRVGDKVLTHDGSYQKVTKTKNNGKKDILILKAKPIDEIKTTKNHKFYIKKKRDANPEWIEIKDLRINHYLGIAVNYEFFDEVYPIEKEYKARTRTEIYQIGQFVGTTQERPYEIKKEKNSYKLKVLDNTDDIFYEDGYIWYKVEQAYIDEKDTVYDIEVENNHSFTVQNTIVHNCTDISCIGEQKGFSKGSGTRSSLLWDCEKIIDVKRPKFLLMENVKALVGKKNIDSFNEWIKLLEELGYNNYWQVLNSLDYGIPQNRERVFLVSILKKYDKGFKFPRPFKLNKDIRDLLIDKPNEKLYYPDFSIASYMNYDGSFPRRSRFLTQSKMTNLNHISPTITASGGNKCTSAAIYEPKTNNPTWSIENLEEKEVREKTTVNDIIDNYRVRRLAPIENFRLMGVSDEDFRKAEKVCSKTQLNKQAGNAIVVDVLYYIFKELLFEKK